MAEKVRLHNIQKKSLNKEATATKVTVNLEEGENIARFSIL